MARQLVVNADDFGYTHDVNAGIVEAHQRGILTATTLMAEGDAFDDAVQLARENPDLDVGVHLVLVGMPGLPPTLAECVLAVYAGKIDIYKVLSAQIQKIISAGIWPTHMDTHKHTHLLPPVQRVMCNLADEFRIRWIRTPADLPVNFNAPLAKTLLSLVMRRSMISFRQRLCEHECRSTDHFAGFALTGRYTEKDLVKLFAALPAGLTEFMCHPGHCTDELRRRTDTRLRESRAEELRALTHPATRAALKDQGIELVRYRDL